LIEINLDNKAGLVTGASSGIGRASALAFSKAGASVIVADLDEEGGQETVQQIKDNDGEAEFFKVDVSNPENVKEMVEFTVDTFGKIDFAHNNAGITTEPTVVDDVTIENWKKNIDINLNGVFYSMKYEIEAMKENSGGAIINTASTAGIEGSSNMVPYVAAKHGVVGLTKTAALDHGEEGIRVNALAPGTTESAIVDELRNQIPEQIEQAQNTIPTGEFAEAEDQAYATLFLASDLASQINGVVLPVDGGYTTGK